MFTFVGSVKLKHAVNGDDQSEMSQASAENCLKIDTQRVIIVCLFTLCLE